MSALSPRTSWQAVLFNPSVAALDAQRVSANWTAVWYSLLGLAVVQAVVALFQRAEAFYWNTLIASPQIDQYMRNMGIRTMAQMNPSVGAIEAFVNAFLGFFVMVGLVYLVARMVGGVGSFLRKLRREERFYVSPNSCCDRWLGTGERRLRGRVRPGAS